jgi:hypothetical protein
MCATRAREWGLLPVVFLPHTRPENPLPFSSKITAGEITKICKGFSGLELPITD